MKNAVDKIDEKSAKKKFWFYCFIFFASAFLADPIFVTMDGLSASFWDQASTKTQADIIYYVCMLIIVAYVALAVCALYKLLQYLFKLAKFSEKRWWNMNYKDFTW
jgi:TRAP-type mannitol/chloroaromatic compound transport system permease small subunit